MTAGRPRLCSGPAVSRALVSILVTLLAPGAASPPEPPTVPGATAPPGPAEGQAREGPEATSLLGRPLEPPALDEQARARLQAFLDEARLRHEQDPHDEENVIWLGRRLAYLYRYREAVEVFTAGLAGHPRSYRLLRHRGHRFITLRRLDEAIADLSLAADLIAGLDDEVEPDGQPNPQNIPRSTTQTNIYYHLGLALYLQGHWTPSRRAFRKCLEIAPNDDMVVAASYWTWLTLMRQGGRGEFAAAVLDRIGERMDVIENAGYHDLLLLFKGLRTPEQVLADTDPHTVDGAARGYGVGAWHLVNGRTEEARRLFAEVVAGPMWPAFGHIAAEAELARGTAGPAGPG